MDKAYGKLWKLIDKKEIYLETLDFGEVCRRIGAPREEMDSLLVEELGFCGDELLIALRRKSEQKFFIQMQNAQ